MRHCLPVGKMVRASQPAVSGGARPGQGACVLAGITTQSRSPLNPPTPPLRSRASFPAGICLTGLTSLGLRWPPAAFCVDSEACPRGALSPLELPLRTEYRAWDMVGPTHSESAKFRESCSICSCHHLSSLAQEAEANSEKFKEKEIYRKSIGVLDGNWGVKSAFQFVRLPTHCPPAL